MIDGLIGKKLGMTQMLDGDGRRVAVTVIEAGPCVVVQRKRAARDGYEAVQLGFGPRKESRTGKPAAGHFKRAGGGSRAHLREFGLDQDGEVEAGQTVDVSLFEGVAYVDVTGVSKGRGFQGVVKRYRMRGGPMSHGGHSKRRVGSIGQCSYPARVIKGQRMPGHMGRVRVTQQNLRIVGIRNEDNLLLIRGAVAGPAGGLVMVRRAKKKR